MKVISQETFDLVVLENIVEFDNTLEEAIDDACKEFESQGVVFGNIVKNPRLSDDGTKLLHDVLESLSAIKNRTSSSDTVDIPVSSALATFTRQCKLSIAHRVLASKHDGYEILLCYIKDVKESGSNDSLAQALQAMSAVTDTNPDILTPEGVELMIQLFENWETRSDDEQVCIQLVHWCLECCLKHENNRQTLVDAGIPTHLKTLLLTNKESKTVTKATCKAIRSITLDDDIRTEFGKAHDHARLLVEEHEIIKTCLQIIKGFLNDSDVTSEILATLSRLCVRAEYCQEAVDNDALVVLNDVLVSFPDNAQLNRQSMNLLKTISGNDHVKDEVMNNGAGQLIVAALIKHQNSETVCESACAAISMLALRVPAHAKHLAEYGAADAVVHAMKIHKNCKQVQKIGCMAIRNLVARVPENRNLLIECQVEDVIRSALEAFESDYALKDCAKAALRDLELEVKLEEQWRGTRGEIDR